MDAFAACGLDPAFYSVRPRGEDELLPWDHIDCGVTKEYLLRSWRQALEGKTLRECSFRCAGCGADRLRKGEKCDVG